MNPLVSIILATYNRSNALAFAIRSVLAQTRQDWELLVIGDCCSDDTAEVVAAFGDARIRFTNLAQRVGDQSGPNNFGYGLARGRYIAYLNHDDLWFADHLERAIAHLEATAADMVFGAPFIVEPNRRVRLHAIQGAYHPILNPPISAWIARRELIASVGPMRPRLACYGLPTQNWLFRCWRSGRNLQSVPAATLLVLSSGLRKNTYAERQEDEQAYWLDRMQSEPCLREALLTVALMHARPTHLRAYRFALLLSALTLHLVARLALVLGMEPEAVFFQLRLRRGWRFWPRRGVVFEELYRQRGLPPLNSGEKQNP